MTPQQAKAARALLHLPRIKICRLLGITPNTLDRVECRKGRAPISDRTNARLQRFYEAAGADFGDEQTVSLKPQPVADPELVGSETR